MSAKVTAASIPRCDFGHAVVTGRVRLTDLALFEGIGPETVEGISRGGVVRSWPAGGVIWRAGGEAGGLHVLLNGHVRAVRDWGGREVIVHRSKPGDTLGEIPLFDGGTYPATLLAETDVDVLVVPANLLREVMAREPTIAWRLLQALGGRVRHLADRLQAQVAGSVELRLARFLLARAPEPDVPFDLGMSQESVAAELGTVREVVSRTLAAFVRDGSLLRVDRARYQVTDRATLLRHAAWI